MRLLGLDIETTGLDHDKDFVTEIAWVVKDHRDPKPVDMQSHFIHPEENFFELKPEIQQLTKITMAHLKHGKPLEDVLRWLADTCENFGVEAIVAHNGGGFDKPFLQNKSVGFDPTANARVFDRLWVDTSVDCVFHPDCRHTNLLYVAAYFGFVNPFPHAALFDVATMLKVLDQFEIGPVVERAKTPWIFVKACVSFENKDLAKARRYYWEKFADQMFPKTWVKRIKESELAKEIEDSHKAGFNAVKLP